MKPARSECPGGAGFGGSRPDRDRRRSDSHAQVPPSRPDQALQSKSCPVHACAQPAPVEVFRRPVVPDQRRRQPTEADVAALAGCSRTTVSFVMNGRSEKGISPATWRRVEAAARELGYSPNEAARQLAGGQSQTLGLVLTDPQADGIHEAVLPEVIRGVGAGAERRGYRLVIRSFGDGPQAHLPLLRSQTVAGLVIVAGPTQVSGVPLLTREGYQVVVIGQGPVHEVPVVFVDDRDAAHTAADHLLQLGHVRIGFVTTGSIAAGRPRQWLFGYRDALEGAGGSVDASMILDEVNETAGLERLRVFMATAKPSALCVMGHALTHRVSLELRARRVNVPGSLSLLGVGEFPGSEPGFPALTVVESPARALGEAAAALLLDGIEGRTVPRRTLLKGELVVRDSTAPWGKRPKARAATR